MQNREIKQLLTFEGFESSFVRGVIYDPQRRTLTCALQCADEVRKYRYEDVPLEIFEAFSKADSVGTFYTRYIKRVTKCTRIA